MKTYRIQTPDNREFITNNAADLNKAPIGSTIHVGEMTESEYQTLPASNESAKFFA
jgi:hypothetical protein